MYSPNCEYYHLLIALSGLSCNLPFKITLLRVIPTMTCRVGVVRWGRWGLLSTFIPHEKLAIIGLHNWHCLHTFAIRSLALTLIRNMCRSHRMDNNQEHGIDPHADWRIFWHSFWHLLTFSLKYLVNSCDIFSDILSDISSDVLSDISSNTLSDVLSGISPDILSDILSDICFFLT